MKRFAAAIALTLIASSPALASGGSRYGCPETRWCGCWLAKHLHIKSQELYRAFAWLKVGHRVSKPKVGAIVVFGHSHVGQVTGVQGNKIKVLSGNDGSAVRNRLRSTAGVIGYRVL